MLLVSEGLTTPLLQAAVGAALRAQVHRLRNVSAAAVTAAAREILQADATDRFLIRHTTLVLPSGLPVSENIVVLRLGVDPKIDAQVEDKSRPIGFALIDAGLITQRRLLYVGPAVWPHARCRRNCAGKTYVLSTRSAPALCIQEAFNPRFIPAISASGTPTGVQNDHRMQPLRLLRRTERHASAHPPPSSRIASPARADTRISTG
jgi:hypothetical protein